MTQPKEPSLCVLYTNYKGETSTRNIIPKRIWFGSNKWHERPQYLIDAYDADKQAERTFAWNDIVFTVDPGINHRRFTATIVLQADSFQHLLDAFDVVDEMLGKGQREVVITQGCYNVGMMVHEEVREKT